MDCVSCGRATKTGDRFCAGCGASLVRRCPACGAECQPDARFCAACGAALAAGPATAAVARKVVTIVFADLIGSTALQERLDPESVSRIMEGYHAAVRAPIEAHDGTVVQLLGDGVMCAFGIPRVAEDDALRAVRAAVDVQRSFREFMSEHAELTGRVGLRVAVNTGEVVVSDDYTAGIGDPLNVAARLQQEAKDGDVLLGEATQRLVAERVTLERVGSFALKGRAEPVTAYRVVSLDRPAGVAATPFVGRDDELRRITAVYDAALAKPAARLAVVLGSPGLGKSRLLHEFSRQLGERASVLTAQCNPAGGATFAPLAEALRAHLGLEAGISGDALRAALDARVPGEDAERARIANGVGALLAGTPASPEETFFVVRRLLAALAAERPLVLAIDDVQWAEPLLLDFTEHLVQWGASIPLLVLAAARPELRETRSSLTTAGGLVSDVVTLTGLDAGAAMRLAGNVIGADTLPAAVAGRVLTASEGNPLFLRELVRMLVNDGALRRDGERWILTVDLAALEIPPTIQALLAARIERLRPEERLVLERAAVVGRQFSRAAVTHLLPREAHGDLDARLEALRRSELIEADAGWLLGEPALRFHHVLIRDAAYRRVLRGTRAELHERFADWLEARAGESAAPDETTGWHLEQAHQQLRELGALDANGRALGERAARYLAAAGRAALARDDLPPAASLLGRALDCLGDADPARAELALDWCEALLSAGDVAPAARAIAELGRFTTGSERLSAWHTCFSGQLAALADPKALRASAEAVAAAAEVLAAAGDIAGEAKAHQVHAEALGRLGRIGACEAALDKALAAARRVRGERRRANAVLAGIPLAALWGPSPVTRASGRCLDVVRVLRITEGAPAVEAVALRCQAVLETLRGRSDAARRMIASSRRMVEELGITQRLLEADQFAGLIELLEGDPVAAERWLSKAYEGFRAHGLGVAAAQAAAQLGRALLAQGRADEAEALSHESEALAGDDFKAAIAWRGVRAEALAGRGEYEAAVELARAAVEIAAATDDPLDHADARSALAVALRAAGRSSEADAEALRALELWEQKGATLLAERARRGVGRVAPAERAPDARVERPRPEPRRVGANRATETVARLDAALAARDAAALDALLAAGAQALQHPIGFSEPMLSMYSSGLVVRDQTWRHEPLGTLGDSLALLRMSISGSEVARENLDIGAYDLENPVLIEVGADGRCRAAEYFAPERLGAAIARLYERYAELLPDGPERARAAATARTVEALMGPPERWPFAPDAEATDPRTVGFGSVSGRSDVMKVIRILTIDLTEGFTTRADDILGLRSGALLVRWTTSGIVRVSGGAFERNTLMLWVFGANGLISRWEQLDAEREAEALARFDPLTAGPPPAVHRRVRPNAATANQARLDLALAARDADALPILFAEDAENLEHMTGASYGRSGLLDQYRKMLRTQDLSYRHEPLATLGDSLALCRLSVSGSGAAGRTFDVGAFEFEGASLVEVDADGRSRRAEDFPADRLGDAIPRLYERYAELLPDGPERTRAAATARSVAGLVGPFDLERYAAAAPTFESVDHRTLGTWSAQGNEAWVEHMRALVAVADGIVFHLDDVLGLRPGALLVRCVHRGTDRASGGSYERPYLQLMEFGADGLLTHNEVFDTDRDAEALARFDELAAEPPGGVRRRVSPNAATENAARTDAAIAARDAAAIPALFADESEGVDHTTGTTWDRSGQIASWLALLHAREPTSRHEPLATLGNSFLLGRTFTSGSGFAGRTFDVGPYEIELVGLIEVDTQGRRWRTEAFAPDRLGAAIACLYERYAERLPDGPERTRAALTARAVAAVQGFDLERWAAALAPAVEFADHRALGFPRSTGAEAYRRRLASMHEVAADVAMRIEDVLALSADALLVRLLTYGSDRAGGGAFENSFLNLFVFGADGRVTHHESFDIDREAEAFARFDALTAVPSPTPFANAAWRAVEASDRAIERRDWDALVALYAPGTVLDERRSLVRIFVSGEASFANLRLVFDATRDLSRQLLRTRGERLTLDRMLRTSVDRYGGLAEFEYLVLNEVDATGRRVASVTFDLGDLDAAYAELDARYAAGEGAAHAGSLAAIRRFGAALAARDWAELTRVIAPDLAWRDHRRLGLHEVRSRDEYLASLRAWLELVPDVKGRIDHVLALDGRHMLAVAGWVGTREGGPFEISFILVLVLDSAWRIAEYHTYDLDQLAEARARFAELRPDPTRIPPNAATRASDLRHAAWQARDRDALRALASPDFVFDDRSKISRVSGDVEMWIENNRFVEPAPTERELIATAGDRVALERVLWRGEPDGAPVEREHLRLTEVDAEGRIRASLRFDPDDRAAAFEEAHARFAAGEAAASEGQAPFVALLRALTCHDWEAVTGRLTADAVVWDRRALGILGVLGREGWVESLRAVAELAPDVDWEVTRILTWNGLGRVHLTRMFGTRDGGPFENPIMNVILTGGGRIQRFEFFDVADADRALARFEELCAGLPERGAG